MNWLGIGLRGLGLVSAALLVEAAGCLSTPFVNEPLGTGGSGSGGGAAGGTSGGTGGTVAGCSACASGQYCNTSTSTCAACNQLGRFQFETPVALGLVVPGSGASALYPRVDKDTGDLYLVQQSTLHLDQLARAPYMAGKNPWPAAMLLPKLMGTHQDSGPLYIHDPMLLTGFAPDAITKLGAPVLLFDSDRATSRRIFAVDLAEALTPVQLTFPGGAATESRIAVATDAATPRFFWISDAGGATPRLVTSVANVSAATEVTIVLDTGCPVPLADTPWVTPKGDLLLFTSPHYGPSPACGTPDVTLTHLYQVPIDSSGQATAKASLVLPTDPSTDTTPTLSPDLCTLLFARVDDTATAKIFAASRN